MAIYRKVYCALSSARKSSFIKRHLCYKIEETRSNLEQMILNQCNKEKILACSQALDALIHKYYQLKAKGDTPKSKSNKNQL